MPQLVAYASYTETFVQQTEHDSSDRFLDPITGESREMGLKSEWFNGRLIASLAYFDVIQTNIAVLDPNT
ncbi:TonB-dependent receptor, partial [Psychrobacter sp. CAL606-MNA-CIBAN-0158]